VGSYPACASSILAGDSMNDIEQLRKLLVDANRVTVFTGAGISTESGIPDYRGPQGVWTLNPNLMYVKDNSVIEDLKDSVADAAPNAGHLAIVKLWEQTKLQGVVTQNIDRLHQKAGIPDFLVHELHGSGDKIVNFGDQLDETTWFKAYNAIFDCDLLLVLGTSLQVYPAAGLVSQAQDDGIKNVIVNLQPTPYDDDATLVIHEGIGETLTKAILDFPPHM
jgi:NAD-dependent deacetylase